MAMPAIAMEWTVDMLDALPDDGNRYEIIDGQLFVTPSPNDVHQYVVGELHALLLAYLKPARLARSVVSPSDIRREDRTRNRVQPDVFVLRVTDGRRPSFPFDLSDLLLAVEVVSPSSSSYDHHRKRRLYLRGGVPEYWIVDPEARTVTVWRSEEGQGEMHAERLTWLPPQMSDPLVIDLERFFFEALDA
ncbi:MAG TPA: Uma2 family endonuclease [Gemmatimonadaceae bacterium]|jgi:Uma2 family endonuclease